MSPRLAAELERLRAEEEAREAEKVRKAENPDSDSESFDEEEPDTRKKTRKLKSNFFLTYTSGQSYKHFTLVNYDSRGIPDLKIPHIMSLEL